MIVIRTKRMWRNVAKRNCKFGHSWALGTRVVSGREIFTGFKQCVRKNCNSKSPLTNIEMAVKSWNRKKEK